MKEGQSDTLNQDEQRTRLLSEYLLRYTPQASLTSTLWNNAEEFKPLIYTDLH